MGKVLLKQLSEDSVSQTLIFVGNFNATLDICSKNITVGWKKSRFLEGFWDNFWVKVLTGQPQLHSWVHYLLTMRKWPGMQKNQWQPWL